MIIFGGLPPSTRWPPPNASRILRLPLSLFAYVLLPLLASSVARSLLASAVRRVSFSLCGASFPDFSPHVLSPPVSLETPPSPVAASLRITSPSPNFSTFAPPIQLLLFLLFRPLTFGCNLSWPENRRVFSINSNRPDWKPPGPLWRGRFAAFSGFTWSWRGLKFSSLGRKFAKLAPRWAEKIWARVRGLFNVDFRNLW